MFRRFDGQLLSSPANLAFNRHRCVIVLRRFHYLELLEEQKTRVGPFGALEVKLVYGLGVAVFFFVSDAENRL